MCVQGSQVLSVLLMDRLLAMLVRIDVKKKKKCSHETKSSKHFMHGS